MMNGNDPNGSSASRGELLYKHTGGFGRVSGLAPAPGRFGQARRRQILLLLALAFLGIGLWYVFC